MGTLGSSAAGAMGQAEGREAAVVTFLVAASGISVVGIGAAFWALLAGLLGPLGHRSAGPTRLSRAGFSRRQEVLWKPVPGGTVPFPS